MGLNTYVWELSNTRENTTLKIGLKNYENKLILACIK